jgi:hypothetical protein
MKRAAFLAVALFASTPAHTQIALPYNETAGLMQGLGEFCMPFMAGRRPMTARPPLPPSPIDASDFRMAESGLTVPLLTGDHVAGGWSYGRRDGSPVHVFQNKQDWGQSRVSMNGTLCTVGLTPSRARALPYAQLTAETEAWIRAAFPLAHVDTGPPLASIPSASTVSNVWQSGDGIKVTVMMPADQTSSGAFSVSLGYYPKLSLLPPARAVDPPR